MNAVEILKREHSEVSLVAEAAAERLERLEQPGVDVLEVARYAGDLVAFLRDAGDCHDPKEDLLLAAVLHRRVSAWGEGPVGELVREREELRLMLRSAADWLALTESGNAAALQPLVYDLRLYLDLLRRHIAEEEALLFPLATDALTAEEVGMLARSFELSESKTSIAGLRDRHPGITGSAAPGRAAPGRRRA
jgi:hemerythrin-like domain-containing protein